MFKFGKRRKYHNKPVYTTATGLFVSRDHPDAVKKVFDSEKEFRRWKELVQQQKAGLIYGLRRQHTLKLKAENGVVIARYIADFTYFEDGRFVIEDVKSPVTKKLAMYRLKKKWVEVQYGVTIRET